MPLGLVAQTFAVCAASFTPACHSEPPNLLVNGSFDNFDLTGWTLDCPDGGCSVVADPSTESGAFKRVNLSSAQATLGQSLQLKQGLYVFEYEVLVSSIPSGTEYNEVIFNFGPQTSMRGFPNGSFGGDHRFFVDDGSVEIQFALQNVDGVGEITLDDFKLFMMDDSGAALSAASSHASFQERATSFSSTIFRNAAASRPLVPTRFAGPAAAVKAQYATWVSGGAYDATWDTFRSTWDGQYISGGIETNVADAWTSGVAASFSGRTGAAKGPASSSISSVSDALAAVYAAWRPENSQVSISVAGGGGFSRRDLQRTIVSDSLSEPVKGIDGWQWFISAELGYAAPVAPGIAVTPFVKLDAGTAHEEGFDETNSDVFTLVRVASSSRDSVRSTAGLSGAADVELFGSLATLGGRLAWAHEFLDPDGVVYSFYGAPILFVSPAQTTSRDTAVFGVSLDFASGDQSTFYIRYDGEVGGDHSTNSGQIGLRTVW